MRPALVSGPQTGRSHIINILLASLFRSVLLITDRVFFHRFMARGALRAWVINRWKKKLGPKLTVRTENSANKRYLHEQLKDPAVFVQKARELWQSSVSRARSIISKKGRIQLKLGT